MTSSRPLGRVCGIPGRIVVFVSLLFCWPSLARTRGLPSAASASLRTNQLFFERNDGQADRDVMYLSRASCYSIFLTHTGITVVLTQPARKNSGALPPTLSHFRLIFENANSQAQVAGVEQLPGISNYFAGSDQKQWHTRIPQFAKVRYSQLYPGIDLIFYFGDGQLEYDLVVSPGANLTTVHFRIEGAAASLTRAGEAAIKIGAHDVVRWGKPHAYQEGMSTTAVSAHYSLHQGKLSFTVDHYDQTQPLVIDPALIFATYISSNCLACSDQINDIAADNTGVYLTGSTNASSFPATANGPTPTQTSNGQTFVIKLDPTGSHLLYATFLSASVGQAIAVDGLGSTYISGIASMGSPAFPLTSGVFSGTIPANPGVLPVGYAAKLSPDGSAILYSTLLQQPTADGSFVPTPYLVSPGKIAVDSTGALYVGGITEQDATLRANQSVWMSLPVTVGAFQTKPGFGFVLKLNPNASGLDYATYIDGVGAVNTSIVGIEADSTGDAFVAGSTASGGSFPTTPGAYETSAASGFDTAFVMKLNPTGTAQVYSTLFGSGTANVKAFGLGVDPQGRAVLAGFSAGGLPTTSSTICGASPPPPSAEQGFVTKFTSDGSGLVYSTSVCTSNSSVSSVAVDSAGAAYVVGTTDFPTQFEPVLLNPIQGYVPSTTNWVNILLKVDTSGTLQWSTFLGVNFAGLFPTNSELAIDGAGAIYVLAESNIPPTPNSIGPASLTPGVPQNAEILDYLLKVAPSLGAPVPLSIPNQVSFGSENVGVASAPADVQVGNFGDAPMSPLISTTGDFRETGSCSGSIPGGQKCDINVVFTPTATGNRTGTLTIRFGGNIPSQTVALSGVGTAPTVSLSPPALYFGVQTTGTTSGQQQVTVTNNGTGPLTVSSVQTTAQFAATNTCGAAIAPGSACSIQVTFTPTSSGIQTGTLTINDNASNSPQTVALTGNQTGNAAVTLSPTSLAFAVQTNGTTSAPQAVTVTNSGTAPLVISSAQTSSQFAANSACPASVQPGSTCTIQVTFTPSASGTQTGTLTIADNAANSPQTVSLAGNQPAGFSVTAPGGLASTSASISAGQTATYNLSVSGTFGFSGGVSFTCSGAPSNSTCSVSPNPANITGTTAVALTVSVATQAPSSVFMRLYPPAPFPAPYALPEIAVTFALLLCFVFAASARQRRFTCFAGALALTLLAVVFAGCGGSGSYSTTPTQPSNPGTAAGQYMLSVTGKSGSLSQSISLTLTVK